MTFDKTAYQREYMRKRRAEAKEPKPEQPTDTPAEMNAMLEILKAGMPEAIRCFEEAFAEEQARILPDMAEWDEGKEVPERCGEDDTDDAIRRSLDKALIRYSEYIIKSMASR